MSHRKAKPGTARYLELILAATDQGIYVLDERGYCTLFNRAASTMTGWRPDEVLGRNIHDLIHHTQPGGSPHLPEECPVLSVLRTGAGVHKDNEVYWRRDGTPFPAEYSCSLIVEDGRTVGAVVVFSDVTERREAEETYRATLNILDDFDEERRNVQLLQKATVNLLEDMSDERNKLDQTQRATLNILEDFDEEKAKLKQVQQATMNLLDDMDQERNRLNETQSALVNMLEDMEESRIKAEQSSALLASVNQELEAFSYSVSHDLQAPLRAISGFAQAVVEDYSPKLDEQGKRYLGLVQDNAHRMGQLIDDLLKFSRLGRQPMVETEIDMETLARDVFEDLAAQAPQRTIEFKVHPAPPLHGDKAMIRQVLVNLLSNAIKFTRTREHALIEFGHFVDMDENVYYIRDNGVGFDMQYADKLFGVFQRLHPVTQFEGTGVGLALVYRIITRHGGRTWADSQVDHGATFYFTLPDRGTR